MKRAFIKIHLGIFNIIDKSSNKLEFVHTLNGSGLATPRLMIALLETNQNSKGEVIIPKPISSYFGKDIID